MIKGIVSLITSGILFNPCVLSGIIIGCIISSFDQQLFRDILTSWQFYAIILSIAAFFCCKLNKVYYVGGKKVNWSATLGVVLWQSVILLATTFFVSFLILTFVKGGHSTEVAIEKIKQRYVDNVNNNI